MSFHYNPSLPTDRDRVRFHIRDTVHGSGPLPGDANFEDSELDALIGIEGIWQRAVPAAFEALAAAWRKYPNLESDQFGLSRSHISRGYYDDAKQWREKWGYAGDPDPVSFRSNRVVAGGLIRVDGFGDDAYVGQGDV